MMAKGSAILIEAYLRNLISEETNKTVDERRVLILKCQIYQLEKQVSSPTGRNYLPFSE
jgi:hypothetical protein